jgi:predicted secreted Zn-dependent protease
VRAFLSFAAIFGLGLVDPAPTQPRVGCVLEPIHVFYHVTGAALSEIHASLRDRGPRDERGSARFAYTDWTIEWNWGTAPVKRVELDLLRVQCSATIRLPKLVITPDTPISVVRAWHDFVERTRDHEMRHVEHVTRGSERIRQRLEAAQARIGELSPKQANAIVSRVIQEIKEFDRAYDRRTNHGHTEGTWELLEDEVNT